MEFAMSPQKFWLLWIVWVLVMIGTAVALRLVLRLPFFKPRVPDVRFDENWCSGASSTGLMGEFGWAKRCVWLVVTGDSLRVGVHFPFNLFMPPFVLGLDLSVPLGSVSSVERAATSWAGDRVKVSYSVTDDTRGVVSTRSLWVQPTRHKQFIGTLGERTAEARRVHE
jgi:hypothetical protein